MWLLFHRNAKTRVVRDGQSFIETCPECGRKARFDTADAEQRRAQAEARANRIEDELAELKKRLGR
ncbi:MAG TPA: hypothetical protein VF469_28950 [Kofleriaceae bacterium]